MSSTDAGTDTSGEIIALRREIRELRRQLLDLQEQVRRLGSIGARVAPPLDPAGAASAAPESAASASPASQAEPVTIPSPAAQEVPPQPPPEAVPAAPEAPALAPEGSPEQAPPSASAPTRSPGLLNPAISAVFQGIGDTSIRRERDDNGFDLSEAEIAMQSVVDPFAKVDLFLAFPDAESAEVEEGFVTTLALPGSLQLKGGRIKSALGMWNTLHTHAFFTVDRPDALERFFGEESFTSDGLSLSLLVPNPWDLYVESVTEVGTAREGPAFNSAGRALTYLQRLAVFFDLGPSSSLGFGLSASAGRTGPSENLLESLADPNVPASLTPDENLSSAVQGLDLTYKWRPPQQNVYRSFLWQTEVLRSHRRIEELTPALSLESGSVTSLGGYTYLETQFVKRWKEGLRVDVSGLPDDERARLWAASAVVKFYPSEFQELRFQVRHSRHDDRAALLLGEEESDTRILFEWIPIIGAHGAHKF